jgi:hypothetical protein
MFAFLTNLGDWTDLSVGVAALVTLVYVARTLRATTRDTITYLSKANEDIIQHFGNHFSHIIDNEAAVAERLGEIAGRLEGLSRQLDHVHREVRFRGEA